MNNAITGASPGRSARRFLAFLVDHDNAIVKKALWTYDFNSYCPLKLTSNQQTPEICDFFKIGQN